MWYRPGSRLQVGLAYLWEQQAVRVLANYLVVPEKGKAPGFKVGAGIQSITTGNPGYFAVLEKGFHGAGVGVSAYAGVGYRSNEDHFHGLGGFRLVLQGPWRPGVQLDGHEIHPYLMYEGGDWVAGFYWANVRRPGWLFGLRW